MSTRHDLAAGLNEDERAKERTRRLRETCEQAREAS
jgi:hypothetical protein